MLLAQVACERTDSDANMNRRSTTIAELHLTGHAIEDYLRAHGELPPQDPAGFMSALGMKLPLDGWSRPLRYKPSTTGEHPFQLYSLGPDGRDDNGGGSNIDYWAWGVRNQ